ncbi:MAG: HPr family phosphocarrier protein [Christensenellales bacterium]|jgi:phosphotransferase system HPr (HPr) family protein
MIKDVNVTKPNGLQTNECAVIARLAGKACGDVFIIKGNKRVNGKSIMGLLSLNMKFNEAIQIYFSDEDEKAELVQDILAAF